MTAGLTVLGNDGVEGLDGNARILAARKLHLGIAARNAGIVDVEVDQHVLIGIAVDVGQDRRADNRRFRRRQTSATGC